MVYAVCELSVVVEPRVTLDVSEVADHSNEPEVPHVYEVDWAKLAS